MKKTINVTKAILPPKEEYIDEVSSLWDTHWITNSGIKYTLFKKNLEEFLNVSEVEVLANGHLSLELAIKSMNLEGEIITTPFTFISTTHAIVRNGCKPVFCDINKMDYTIDASQIEKYITNKTVAIVPVHVYGNVCNVAEIDRIAKKHGLAVIYDAAHSFGETLDGVGIGNFGDMSCFSFHATKVFNTVEGGAICFNNSNHKLNAERVKYLKNFGIEGPESIISVGMNAKLNEFSCAMGLCNLRHYYEHLERRKAAFELYGDLLGQLEGVKLPLLQKNVSHNYAYYPILINPEICGFTRDELFAILAENEVYTRKYFYPLVTETDCYNKYFDSENVPVALSISKSVLCLPLHSYLNEDDVIRICDIVKSVHMMSTK